MSTKISKKKFTELLRTLIKREIDEASTTASAGIDGTGTGHYDTPRAFSGKGKDRRNSVASGSGYEKVNEAVLTISYQPIFDADKKDKLEKIAKKSGLAIRSRGKQGFTVDGKRANVEKFIKATRGMIEVKEGGPGSGRPKDGSSKEKSKTDDKEMERRAKDQAKKDMEDEFDFDFDESVNEGSLDWEKNFKWANEKELKVIAKVVHMSNGIAPVIKMSKKKDFKPFIKKAAQKGLGESINESATDFWMDMFRPGPIPNQYINQLIKKKGMLPSKSHIKRIYRDNGNPKSTDLAKAFKQLSKEKYIKKQGSLWRWEPGFTWEAVTEDAKDVAKARKLSQKLQNVEGRYRKAMYDLSDRLQADPKNHKLQNDLVKSYTKNVTSFMRDMVKITKRVK